MKFTLRLEQYPSQGVIPAVEPYKATKKLETKAKVLNI